MAEISEGSKFIVSTKSNPEVTSTITVLEKGDSLGKGIEGNITRVLVAPITHEDRGISLAYKELSKRGQQSFDSVFQNYTSAKDSGLPVPQTFRGTEDKKGILMTDLTAGGKNVVISQNNVGLKEVKKMYEERPDIMAKFAHTQELLSQATEIQTNALADKATQSGLDIGTDAWFVIIKPEGSYDFVLGDFSGIEQQQRVTTKLKDENQFSLTTFREMIALVQKYGTDSEVVKKKLANLDFERDWNGG